MSLMVWKDPHGYVWSTKVDDDATPLQINIGASVSIVDPSGKLESFCPVTLEVPVDPHDPEGALRALFAREGTKFYRTPAETNALIGALSHFTGRMVEFADSVATVGQGAEAIADKVKEAAELAGLLFFVPGVGTTLAPIVAALGAVTAGLVGPVKARVIQLIQSSSDIIQSAGALENELCCGDVSFEAAQQRLSGWANDTAIEFWQALRDCLSTVP